MVCVSVVMFVFLLFVLLCFASFRPGVESFVGLKVSVCVNFYYL